MSDAINPAHYKRLPSEAIEIIEAMIAGAPDNKAAYLHGQAAKYDLRLWEKGESLEDFLSDWGKHIWYALRLESYLLELIEKQKASEQQKAADLQSLKDHPFGKLKQPSWTPKVGDWVRIKKPNNTEASATFWWTTLDKYDGQIIQVKEIDGDGVVHEDWGFLFDWLEPAEQSVTNQSLKTQPPDGWRFLDRGEKIRDGDMLLRNGNLLKLVPDMIGSSCIKYWMPIVRRNRFEVGEKVIDCRAGVVFTVQYFNKEHSIVFVDGVSKGIKSKHLAPYIEEKK